MGPRKKGKHIPQKEEEREKCQTLGRMPHVRDGGKGTLALLLYSGRIGYGAHEIQTQKRKEVLGFDT